MADGAIRQPGNVSVVATLVVTHATSLCAPTTVVALSKVYVIMETGGANASECSRVRHALKSVVNHPARTAAAAPKENVNAHRDGMDPHVPKRGVPWIALMSAKDSVT